MTNITGGCHCGAMRFAVTFDAPPLLLDCNCSICARTGAPNTASARVPAAASSLAIASSTTPSSTSRIPAPATSAAPAIRAA